MQQSYHPYTYQPSQQTNTQSTMPAYHPPGMGQDPGDYLASVGSTVDYGHAAGGSYQGQYRPVTFDKIASAKTAFNYPYDPDPATDKGGLTQDVHTPYTGYSYTQDVGANLPPNYEQRQQAYHDKLLKNAMSKTRSFPSSQFLPISQYPDVTNDLNILRDKTIREYKKNELFPNKYPGVLQLSNFSSGHPWDLKSHPSFPNLDAFGNKQYALYRGNIVPSNYLSNNFYGQVMAGVGFPLWQAKIGANMNYKWSRPGLEKFTKNDQSEDEWAIQSVYDEHNHGNPWLHGTRPFGRKHWEQRY